MAITKTIELFKGDFSREDGRDLIIGLLNDKIKFYQLRLMMLWEKTGENDPELSKLLHDLKISRERIKKLIDQPDLNSKPLNIVSNIQISIDL